MVNIVLAGGRLEVQYTCSMKAPAAGPDRQRDRQHRQLRDYYFIADQSFKAHRYQGRVLHQNALCHRRAFLGRQHPPTPQRSDYDGARPVTLLQSRGPSCRRASPDGRRIAYVSFEQKRPRIFIQYVDTGRREQITNFEGLNGAPAFSP